MSLNTFALQPVKVSPATLDVQPKPYEVQEGYENRTFRKYNPSGSAGNYNSGVNWNISMPSGVGLCRRAYVSCRFSITFSVNNQTAGGLAPFRPDYDAPRSYPLNRSIATQTVGINNLRYTQNNGELMDALSHLLDDDVHRVNCLDSVYRRDNVPSYAMMSQSTNNALASYEDVLQDQPARGSGFYNLYQMDNTDVPAGQTQNRVLVFECTEAVLCPPFHYESKQEQTAIYGIQTLSLNINWSQLSRTVWSRIPQQGLTATIQSVDVQEPVLYLEQITPKTGFVLPKQVSYDIFEMTSYTQSHSPTIAAGTTATLYNNNIKLSNSVPSRLFVFARRSPTTLSVDQGNTFMAIDGISIEMNNHSGLLADASPQQLWDLSRSNGLEQQYNEWAMRKFGDRVLSGGLLCIDPAKDLSLDVDQTNGSNGSNQLSITLRVKNNDDVGYDNVQCVVIGLYEGVLNLIDGSKFEYQQGVISRADVLVRL